MTELLTTIKSQEYRNLVEDSTRLNMKVSELFSEQIAHADTKKALKEATERLEKLTGRVEVLEAFVNEYSFRKDEFEAFCAKYEMEVK